jgi:hypothetical protein
MNNILSIADRNLKNIETVYNWVESRQQEPDYYSSWSGKETFWCTTQYKYITVQHVTIVFVILQNTRQHTSCGQCTRWISARWRKSLCFVFQLWFLRRKILQSRYVLTIIAKSAPTVQYMFRRHIFSNTNYQKETFSPLSAGLRLTRLGSCGKGGNSCAVCCIVRCSIGFFFKLAKHAYPPLFFLQSNVARWVKGTVSPV